MLHMTHNFIGHKISSYWLKNEKKNMKYNMYRHIRIYERDLFRATKKKFEKKINAKITVVHIYVEAWGFNI